MKVRTILLLLFVPIFSIAQKPLEYTKSFNVDNKTKENLLKDARPFFLSAYDTNEEIINNADSIVVEGKAYMNFFAYGSYSSLTGKIKYTARLVFKDGLVKFSNLNFTHESEKKAAFNNNMGVLVSELPKKLSDIGVTGATRKLCYKYYFNSGIIMCKKKYDEQVEKLVLFIYK